MWGIHQGPRFIACIALLVMKVSIHDDACLEEFLFEEEETSFRNKTEAVVMAGQTSLSTVQSTTMAALSATWQAHLLKHFQCFRSGMENNSKDPSGSNDVAVLRMPDGTADISLPVKYDSFGNSFIDVTKLYSQTKICTYDPGFMSTASCESKITYIDGDKGILLYRGYRIEDLVEHGDFYDCSYLLLHGELPDADEKEHFRLDITNHTLIHEKFMEFLKGFQHDAHPMAIMCGCVGAMAAFYPEVANVSDPAQQIRACHRLIAKIPTLAAMSFKVHLGQPIIYPRNDLSFSENFLYMMNALPTQKYQVDPVAAKALETILILHLDHEQNASTSTVRTAGSSQANPFTCISSGIASLHGPLHGGASTAVMKMLLEIEQLGGLDAIPLIVERAKDKENPFRLMGFGHRVYKTFDPRAKIMKEISDQVLSSLDVDDPLLDIAKALEAHALQDEYFVKRNLYPNIDFYSGIVMRALGIPVEMYTVIFAMARCVGWVAQWKEFVSEPLNKISRPRQIYSGHVEREFQILSSRSSNVTAFKPPPARMYSTHARNPHV